MSILKLKTFIFSDIKEYVFSSYHFYLLSMSFVKSFDKRYESWKLGNIWSIRDQCKEQQDLGLKFPLGCVISPHNSKVSIEQNFASSNNVAVVYSIKL